MVSLTLDLLNDLNSKYGGSFYILDSDIFRRNCEKLLETFRSYYLKTNIAYSYKTNYIPKLGIIIDSIGGYAEVVSDMELKITKHLGIEPARVIWNGPVKSKKVMEEFLLSGGIVNVDSRHEFSEICEIARHYKDRQISIGLRCNYDIGDGVLSRFGIDVGADEFDEILNNILLIDNINLKSLQAHFAKRHYKYWPAKTEGLLSVYERVTSKFGIYPECIDLGGGLSGEMPRSLREQFGLGDFSLDDYASRSALIFSDYFRGKKDKPWLFIEPGTAVAADCMRYVCRVEAIKEIRGKTIIETNGSQKNISMGSINPPLEVIPISNNNLRFKNADIAGYTCIESDYLYRNYSGKIGVGDYLVFGNCGSYSVVMKPPFIFPNVPILDLSAGKVEEIKRAERFDDIFETYNF